LVSEFSELESQLEQYYRNVLVGFLIYELVEKDQLGAIIVLKQRSPILFEDSIRMFNFVRHIYSNIHSVSVISISELKEKITKADEKLKDFLENVVYIYDKNDELKNLVLGAKKS